MMQHYRCNNDNTDDTNTGYFNMSDNSFKLEIINTASAPAANYHECCSMYRKMDNAAFETDHQSRDTSAVVTVNDNTTVIKMADTTRLKMTDDPKSSVMTHVLPSTSGGGPIVTATTTCRPEACAAARKKYLAQGPDSMNQNPWDRRKTIYFVTIICLLVVWIIVYSTLGIYGIV